MREVVCVNCGEPLPEHKRPQAKYCSDLCGRRARTNKHYSLHKEDIAHKREARWSKHERLMLARVKSRAKKLGIPFNITEVDIKIPDVCPVLGVRLERQKGKGKPCNYTPSLDRIVPALGYVKGNVRVISNRANLLKSNATLEELTLVLEDAIRLHKEGSDEGGSL